MVGGLKRLNERSAVRAMDAPRPRLFKPALTITPKDEAWRAALRSFRRRKSIARIHAWDLRDCTLYPPGMVVADSDGLIVRQTVRKAALMQAVPELAGLSGPELSQIVGGAAPFPAIEAAPVARVIEESCVLLGSAQGLNYFHWVAELLPKLDLVRADVAAGRRLVVPKLARPFHAASLEHFGFNPDQCLAIKTPARFRDLRILSNIARSPTLLSSFLPAAFKPYRGRGMRRLYVSRAHARMRRIVNEADLIALLAARGFETVLAEDLSFAEQARIFGEARLLVGPHGAGLSNLAFMAPGGAVVELLPETFTEGVSGFAAMSEECGQRHAILLCRSLGAGPNADMEVALPALERVLKRLR
ncbi:MAG: DUF563 domain-containing protein [Hyphomonadaceae bacterium]